MPGCLKCGRGFHKECKRCRKGKCHSKEIEPDTELESRKSSKENLRDPISTGRKRAAQLYPIDPVAACEWQRKRNCGGGRVPIIGCLEGLQKDRHHGPVKDTTRNERNNVHRLCYACHHHWHELNDLEYNTKDFNLLPHQPEEANVEEIILDTLEWKTGEIGKKYILASTKNLEKHTTD